LINLRKQTLASLLLFGIGGMSHAHMLLAQEEIRADKSWVFETGPATERDLKKKQTSTGFAAAVEKTVIEESLEVEIGVNHLTNGGERQIGIDVLFKKPFDLSPTTELMFGAGPQLTHKWNGEDRGTSLGIGLAVELMVWLTTAKDIGWYFEPSYGIGLGSTKGERTVGGSAGLLIRLR
jgi:hypothetical protein